MEIKLENNIIIKAAYLTHLRESSVVPNVSMMGKAISHKTKFTLFGVLLDWIKELFFANFKLCIGPSRNFDDHVQDRLTLISKERNVVPRRNWLSSLVLQPDSPVYNSSKGRVG